MIVTVRPATSFCVNVPSTRSSLPPPLPGPESALRTSDLNAPTLKANHSGCKNFVILDWYARFIRDAIDHKKFQHYGCRDDGQVVNVPQRSSSDQPVGNVIVAAHVRDPLFAALEEECQLLMVEPEEPEDRGVQVIDMQGVLNGA